MMAQSKLDAAIAEARRFLSVATDYQNAMHNEQVRSEKAKRNDPENKWKHYPASFPAKSGATRRASMDLTRALAAMRKPNA